MTGSKKKGRFPVAKLFLVVWIVGVSLALGSLGVSHLAAMPRPDDEARIARAALALREDASSDFIVHVIYARCSCTARLFKHLVERKPFPGVHEMILFVGEDSTKRAAAEHAGYEFRTITREELGSKFGLEVAPVMLVFDVKGELRYIGGYFDRPAAVTSLDEQIRGQVLAGANPDPLPVFGCAVDARLQRKVDPLGIVYRGQH
ncbi:MAG TPA: hypothetical protein VN706_10835 [Gemmatimonadaceae bacterium]|nr:hypothetical protein [Gemmatimonadaceae bacterium]